MEVWHVIEDAMVLREGPRQTCFLPIVSLEIEGTTWESKDIMEETIDANQGEAYGLE